MGEPSDRISVTADARRLGVAIQIGDVVVTIAGPAPVGVRDQTELQVRHGALRLAPKALEVAQQDVRQKQG